LFTWNREISIETINTQLLEDSIHKPRLEFPLDLNIQYCLSMSTDDYMSSKLCIVIFINVSQKRVYQIATCTFVLDVIQLLRISLYYTKSCLIYPEVGHARNQSKVYSVAGPCVQKRQEINIILHSSSFYC